MPMELNEHPIEEKSNGIEQDLYPLKSTLMDTPEHLVQWKNDLIK